TVMMMGGDDSPKVREALQQNGKIQIVPTTTAWTQQISDKKVRAAIEIPAGFDADFDRGDVAAVKIVTYDGEMRPGFGGSGARRSAARWKQASAVRSRGSIWCLASS